MGSRRQQLRAALTRVHVRRRIAGLFPTAVRRSYLWKFLVALAVVVLLSAGVSAIFLFGIGETLDRQVVTEARATTEMHATIYSDWFAAREQTLRALASVEYMSGGSLDSASRRLSLEAARSPVYTELHLLDLESGAVLASSSDSAVGRNYYNTSGDAAVITDSQQFVYPGRHESLAGREVVTLVVRLSTANRVLIAEIDPDSGPNPPQPIAGARTQVVAPDGAVVFGPSNRTTVPEYSSDSVTLVRNQSALLSHQRLPDTDLHVVRTTPTEQAFGVKQDVILTFLLTLVLNAGILVVVGLVAGRAATDDLRDLVGKANAMARGSLDIDLESDRKDEIGQLYAAFADMRDALRRRIEESEAASADAQAAREEVEEQKAIISVLNRVLRHNLRNDLVVINGHTEVLMEALDDGRQEHAAIIDSRADDLLDKAEKAREIEGLVGDNQQLQPVDANSILETEVDRFRREYPDVEITVHSPGPARVLAHDALGFVFSNLVENAIEHNDAPRPTVDVTVTDATADNGWVTVEIADNGPGIPRSEIESLRAGYETAIKHGSGLGLWLVNWLVDEIGGSLTFERTSSTGTVVTVRLRPVSDAAGVQSPVESE